MLSLEVSLLVLMACSFLGIIWAILNAIQISKVRVAPAKNDLYNSYSDVENSNDISKTALILDIASYIERGAIAFLWAEYKYIGIFSGIMSILIFFTVELEFSQVWTTVAFLLGAFTSVLCGYIGMRVAVFANYRCAYKAWTTSMTHAFGVAYKAGCVMGFGLTSLGLLMLLVIILVYHNYYPENYADIANMYEAIAGYGLGASTIALFGRVGGGIFTKAADVGADLVGKVEKNLPEDSPLNPATIADNVGDNVGDIAGMGSDLFGSFAESTCAALVISSSSVGFQFQPNTILYPLFITGFGIIASFLTSFFANGKVEDFQAVSDKLKQQLWISTILLTPTLWFAAYLTLPERVYFEGGIEGTPTDAWICSFTGLWSGLIIGIVTEYYTSHSYRPVREVAQSCTTGAATNIIYGLALGNLSTIIPVILLAITAFVSHDLLGMYGVALAALGMLSNLAIGLAIDAYGPVSDNAGGIAEMCELGGDVRRRTDALDAAGNTTAAIGKGFAIGSAGLVSLALYGAFITRAGTQTKGVNLIHPIDNVNVNYPLVFSGLLIGAMLPYAFSALTMKSVGLAANEMVKEVRRQLNNDPGIIAGTSKPNYENCIKIATQASLLEMFWPAAICLLTPFVIGVLFGPTAVAGVLPGILISGVSMAISSANAGGAWDNAKKYIESGKFKVDGETKAKGSDEHKAAVTGDTVGDPLKDTSGPALNILIKLSAIFSLIFYRFFDETALLQCTLLPNSTGCNAQTHH